MKNIYTSVDIGSDTIKIVVCELYKNRLNLIAASSIKSEGIKKGVITNVNMASNSLKKAFKEIEVMIGVKIKKVIISVPSYFAEYKYSEGMITIKNEDNIINNSDVVNCLRNGISNKINNNRELVTIIPIDFIIDNNKHVKSPNGLVGKKLNCRMILVTTPRKNVYSVVNLIESIGVNVEDISFNNIGDINTFKTAQTEKEIGVVINIGAETTTVSLYNKNIVIKSKVIDLGGVNVDNDIAYIYKIDKEQARKIKEKFALAHKFYASTNDLYEVTTKNNEIIKINQFEVSEVVSSRLEEILSIALKEINNLTNKQIQYIIVTGGMSNMAHFQQLIDEKLGKYAIIGSIRLIGVRNNKYSSAIGNIIYFINKLKLRNKQYSMFNKKEIEELSSTKKNVINLSNDSMLGKVFGYFWND